MRQRVADAVREKDAEIASLRARLEQPAGGAQRGAPAAAASTTPAAAAAAAAAPATGTPEWKRFAAMPDAPKLDDPQFQSVEEHSAAMALFIADKRHEERTAADAAQRDAQALTTAQTARVEKFVGQLDAARAADPDFATKLSAEVKALKPFGALQPGEAGGARNVIAEQIYDSPVAPQVLLHFSQHPEELRRLETVPAEIAALPPRAQVRAHIQWIVRQFGALEAQLATGASAAAAAPSPKQITDVETVETLGSRGGSGDTADPVMAAVKRGDFRAFRAAKRARLATQGT